jgi:predicted dehydrogenase
MKAIFYTLLCVSAILMTSPNSVAQEKNSSPIRLAVAGTTHGHVSWILNKKDSSKVVLSGIYEPDKELVRKHMRQFKLPASLFYDNLQTMLDKVKPEAVVAFGSILEHLAVVEACAPKGIHVMVEKPLAVNVQQAERMRDLAIKHKIHLLTNFETSWYPTTEKSYQLAGDNYVGKIRKLVFHHGHEGPKEIGVSSEFFNWLTDPVKNGGGAIIDFGCYGANIMSYFMKGVEPVSVTAVTRQFKPAIYPKVDDEATIVVEYADAQCIIQASWNWPFSRKDMEVYGETGYIITENNYNLRRKNKSDKSELRERLSAEDMKVYEDPFAYFADVIRNRIVVPEHSLYSLSNNLMVVRILDAARESAATGKTIYFNKKP